MSPDNFTPKAYIKEGCPFSFKFLTFMSEAGLLDRVEVVRLNPRGPNFGKEVEPGRYISDSDRLIERYAAEAHVNPDSMPVLSFYKETIFPQLIELFQIKHPKTAQSR